ncbi:hypothetical protein HYR99_36780 [Candidatus Poribacteria bacterium]|nr:hypothetical protein [Candidatus Poribacteria bacterium]
MRLGSGHRVRGQIGAGPHTALGLPQFSVPLAGATFRYDEPDTDLRSRSLPTIHWLIGLTGFIDGDTMMLRLRNVSNFRKKVLTRFRET